MYIYTKYMCMLGMKGCMEHFIFSEIRKKSTIILNYVLKIYYGVKLNNASEAV